MTVKKQHSDVASQDLRAAIGKVRDGKIARRMLPLVLVGVLRKRAAACC